MKVNIRTDQHYDEEVKRAERLTMVGNVLGNGVDAISTSGSILSKQAQTQNQPLGAQLNQSLPTLRHLRLL